MKMAFVVNNRQTSSCSGTGFVQFGSEGECQEALEKMNGFKLMGSKLLMSFARRRLRQVVDANDNDRAPPPLPQPASKKAKSEAASSSSSAPPSSSSSSSSSSRSIKESKNFPEKEKSAPSHEGRLIVRNLGFKANSSDLKTAFSPFGELKEVSLPMRDGKPRGFGFVEFRNSSDAKQAMATVNGSEIANRTVAVDLCLPKNSFIQKREEEPMEQEESSSSSENAEESDEKSDEEDDFDVDLKPEKVDEKGKEEEEEDMDSEERLAVYEAKKKELRDQEKGRNVFVQNVPFEATRKDVIMAFKVCGRIEKVLMVTDRATGRPRGTAFVVFETMESAEKCLELTGRETHEDFQFKVNGRPVVACSPLQEKDAKSISKKRKDHKAEFIGYDKRNIQLAEVGRIDQESPLWANLSTNDKTKRLSAIKTKKQKLVSTNFRVSPVRLSVRNLPKGTELGKLKHM